MRTTIALLLVAFGIAQYIFWGYNILSLMLMILLGFIAGIVSGTKSTRAEKNSDNIDMIATIERNKYFGKSHKGD